MDVYVKVLGIAQDGGVPHLGCRKPCCERARAHPDQGHLVSCIALCHAPSGRRWIVDCTPDFVRQVDLLAADTRLGTHEPRDICDGLLLTHAHIGHYTGLIHLGTEVMSAKRLPVLATASMGAFLSANGPWDALVRKEQIALQELRFDQPIQLAEGLRVIPFKVPHRDEYSDTVGLLVQGPKRTLAFIPDCDKWEKMTPGLLERLAQVHVALLDGSFFSIDELPHRDISRVPHPLMTETVELLGARVATGELDVRFIHLNHSNPALDPESEERRRVEHAGFKVCVQGEDIAL